MRGTRVCWKMGETASRVFGWVLSCRSFVHGVRRERRGVGLACDANAGAWRSQVDATCGPTVTRVTVTKTNPHQPPRTSFIPPSLISIHSANPVVAKHERVAFAPTARPMCDICQVRPALCFVTQPREHASHRGLNNSRAVARPQDASAGPHPTAPRTGAQRRRPGTLFPIQSRPRFLQK